MDTPLEDLTTMDTPLEDLTIMVTPLEDLTIMGTPLEGLTFVNMWSSNICIVHSQFGVHTSMGNSTHTHLYSSRVLLYIMHHLFTYWSMCD